MESIVRLASLTISNAEYLPQAPFLQECRSAGCVWTKWFREDGSY